MAFKMNGKSPMMKALVGKQVNLPANLKAKIEAAPETPMNMYGKSPMEYDGILGPKSKQIIKKGKKVAKKVTGKLKEFAKGFSREEIDKRRNQRYRDYVKKSNKNPKKYPPKSSNEVY